MYHATNPMTKPLKTDLRKGALTRRVKNREPIHTTKIKFATRRDPTHR